MKFTKGQIEYLEKMIIMKDLSITCVNADIFGHVLGNVFGHVIGNVGGDVFGNVGGDVRGAVDDERKT